jgi:hypothetical protein
MRENAYAASDGRRRVGVDDQEPIDDHEFAIRRLTAAAYGFDSWSEFRNWRRRNPKEYRARSRQLVGDEEEPIVIDFFGETRRGRRSAGGRAAD